MMISVPFTKNPLAVIALGYADRSNSGQFLEFWRGCDDDHRYPAPITLGTISRNRWCRKRSGKLCERPD